jgi:hypothetical protein
VPAPKGGAAYRALDELSRGRGSFSGSAKARRSVADRPEGCYGRLRAARPGEYVLLDSTPLDVFAMEPVTLRWVQAELTIAMDLFTRCILGLRLTPVSAKSVDVASVLFEVLSPPEAPPEWPAEAAWPYHGVPGALVVEPGRACGPRFTGPGMLPDTIVVDHGSIYLSEHVTSACARLGVSVQPARPYTPTDKPRVSYCTSSERLAARRRSCRSLGVVPASLVEGRRVGSGRVVEDFAFVVIPPPADNSGVVPDLDGGGGHSGARTCVRVSPVFSADRW